MTARSVVRDSDTKMVTALTDVRDSDTKNWPHLQTLGTVTLQIDSTDIGLGQ